MHVSVASVVVFALLFQASLPLAHFSGTLHGVTKKAITVETEEGNVVEFSITKKTRIERGGKTVSTADLKTGDSVTVEAKREILGYLLAVTIAATVKPGP